MTPLPTFTDVVDSVNDVIATDINPIYAALRINDPATPASAWVHNHTLVGNMVLTDADLPIQSYDPDAAHDITFPALATTNHAFYIYNHTGAFILTCKTPAAVTFATITPDSGMMFFSDGINGWVAVGDNSGTFTPTLDNTTNVAASTPRLCQYSRVGNVVTVSGSLDIDVTAAAVTVLGMTLPIASAFADAYGLGGIAATSVNEIARLSADAANNRVLMEYTAIATGNTTWSFHYTYLVI